MTRMGAIERWLEGEPDARWLADYTAGADLPVPMLFRQLDQYYPGSRFSLTTRDTESWLIGYLAHVRRHPTNEAAVLSRKLRYATYGTGGLRRPQAAGRVRVPYRHGASALSERPDDLVEMSVFEGSGWEPLCTFLERPVPSVPFPWRNRGPGSPRATGLPGLAQDARRWIGRIAGAVARPRK